MINCILGKSKTGKTTHIYQMIEQDLRQDYKVILFVPSQERAKSEEEYMKVLNKSGVIGVNITTISEFVASELKLQNLHIEDKYLSKCFSKKNISSKFLRFFKTKYSINFIFNFC